MGYRLSDLDDQWLLREFFFGIYKTLDDGTLVLENPAQEGYYLAASVIQNAIDAAVDRLEENIGAKIRKRENTVEYHDYDIDLYNEYCLVVTDHYPVYNVDRLRLRLGRNGSTVWDIQSDYIQTDKFGNIRVLPLLNDSQFDPAAGYFSGIFSSHYSPDTIEITYDAGMDMFEGDLDSMLVKAIGLLASTQPFNIMGDIVIGAGIASISTSFDGLSQSVNTTASAENSAFSSRIIQNNNELYGLHGQPGIMDALKRRWRRMEVRVM